LGETEEEPYRPKVTTWGVFPRPRNVSEAYGGGRNIKPGQALETDAQRAAREVGGWGGEWLLVTRFCNFAGLRLNPPEPYNNPTI
jgi:hypothetical protein